MANEAFPALRKANDRIALVDGESSWSYRELKARINRCSAGLLEAREDLREERIAVFAPAGIGYATALHAVWQAGGIAVPLNVAAADAELEHHLANAGATRLIAARDLPPETRRLCGRLGIQPLAIDSLPAEPRRPMPPIEPARRAMILFTSGTSGKPKGAVITHRAIHAQINLLTKAWKWSESDVLPLFLPLHHFHGIINVLNCALWNGACVHAMPRLDIEKLCVQAARGTYTALMAVPTIYVKLIAHIRTLAPADRNAVCAGFGRMRVNISGSAACPAKLFRQWRELTGQVMLERYGTTETGMALSNPYDGDRRAGTVGQALPGVSVQRFDEQDRPIGADATPGEIRIRGDSVMQEYWNNAEATRAGFRNGWFRTGDIAIVEDGYYRILGRSSIDIIKSGGYKLSALEIEGVLLDHEAIGEAAVIGLPDETWGEIVAAIVTLRDGARLDLAGLKQWCDGRMSAYKIPKQLKIMRDLPRNAMGKVVKTALRDLL